MKECFVINIENDTLIFDYRLVNKDEKMFINKNSLYKGYLFYTIKYIKRHSNKVIETIKNSSGIIRTIKIKKLITFKYLIPIIDALNIENLVLDFLSTIDIADYDLFINSKCIKNVYCYFMPTGIVNKFKSNNKNVYMATIKEISSSFLNQQDVLDLDTLYYKNTVKIKQEYPLLLDDLKEFLKINYNLKAIHIYVYSKELIESIVDLVKNDESRNVIVFLHQGYDKGNFIVNNFEWLKSLSEKCKKDYTCEFRIIYANNFLKNNLFKQLTFNNLKMISVLCIYVCLVSLIIIKSYEYIEKVSIQQLKTQMIGNNYTNEYEEEELNDDEIELEEEMNLPPEEKKEKQKEIKSRYSFENSLKTLTKINKEVKGFLIVNNTEINYPIVQHSDNNYYLKYDIYKKKTSMGWVFVDYRNNILELDDNNIIYGHNMRNGTMFGTLKKVLNSTWRKNSNNMIISLDTLNHKYKFKIFSAYKVDYTTDYLVTNFDSEEDKSNFIKLIKQRSVFKSNEEVNINDKILTLSTCAGGNNKRLVVHAVLMKEEETE